MDVRDGFVAAIGDTPLIRLRRASERTGCTILGKAEFLNPGGSVKDRAAWGIVRAAEKSGKLRPGGLIVEGTAGNTGIGLALIGNARGYRTLIVMPETQTREKVETLRQAGAEVRRVPAAPYSDPENYIRISGRLAEDMAARDPRGAIWANQFDNTANRDIHAETTGPEIWRQTGGRLDGFVCAVGTGGTLAGAGSFLKTRQPAIRLGLADPMGAALYNFYRNGVLKAEGTSITEGIGQSRITGNLKGFTPDDVFQITDAEALPHLYDLLRYEGFALGTSTAINIAGAIRLAEKMGPDHTIVTILCDSGSRYASRLYNPGFLREKNLPVPAWLQ